MRERILYRSIPALEKALKWMSGADDVRIDVIYKDLESVFEFHDGGKKDNGEAEQFDSGPESGGSST